jgi:FkbM family methyltransferase
VTYNSEHGQDRWLEENIFRGKRNGIFVEVGALDGLAYSNTLFFERERDWRGVLIEANPRCYPHLLASGRPGSRKVFGAAAAAYGMASFIDVHGVVGWSGLEAEMNPRHLARIDASGGATETYLVPTLPLYEILIRCGLRHIDYMSIDIEGGELSALSSVDFGYVDIDILEVENNYGEPEVAHTLWGWGYRKIHTIEINDIYRRVP